MYVWNAKPCTIKYTQLNNNYFSNILQPIKLQFCWPKLLFRKATPTYNRVLGLQMCTFLPTFDCIGLTNMDFTFHTSLLNMQAFKNLHIRLHCYYTMSKFWFIEQYIHQFHTLLYSNHINLPNPKVDITSGFTGAAIFTEFSLLFYSWNSKT